MRAFSASVCCFPPIAARAALRSASVISFVASYTRWMGVQDLPKYLDVAAQANNKSNQTAEMLMEAYIGVGGTLKNLRVPIQEPPTGGHRTVPPWHRR